MVRVTQKCLHIFLCMYHKQNIYISTYLVCNLSSAKALVQFFSGKCCRHIFSVKVDGTLDGNVLVRPPPSSPLPFFPCFLSMDHLPFSPPHFWFSAYSFSICKQILERDLSIDIVYFPNLIFLLIRFNQCSLQKSLCYHLISDWTVPNISLSLVLWFVHSTVW